MNRKQEELMALLQPVVEAMGCEFIGMDYLVQGKYTVLRIYIDKEGGVTIDDCGQVSQQLGAVLDVEGPIMNRYTLEVSSPGLDRPLFTLAHFRKQMGNNVMIQTSEKIEGQRNFKGIVQEVKEDIIVILVEEKQVELPFKLIQKANVIS